MAQYPDELLADFQQTYGLDVWADIAELRRWEGDYTPQRILRLAALARQLPGSSRTVRKATPDAANGIDTLLLREIEYDLRRWHWANTKDAERGENEPEPYRLPGEDERRAHNIERELRNASDVASQLGISI